MFHDVLRIRLFSLPSAPHSLFDRNGRVRFEFEMAFESMRVDLQGGRALLRECVSASVCKWAVAASCSKICSQFWVASFVEALVLISGHALIVQLAEIRSRYRMAAAPAAGKKGRK